MVDEYTPEDSADVLDKERQRYYLDLRQRFLNEGLSVEDADLRVLAHRALDGIRDSRETDRRH